MHKLVEHVIDEINAKQLAGLALAGTLAASQLPATHHPIQHRRHATRIEHCDYKVGDVLKGEASTYGWGEPLNPKTADGTPFEGTQKLVAMEIVPLETIVTVKSLKTGQQADFRVRDFGPRADTGRLIDLSAAAWMELGLERNNSITDVEVTIKKLGSGHMYHGRK